MAIKENPAADRRYFEYGFGEPKEEKLRDRRENTPTLEVGRKAARQQDWQAVQFLTICDNERERLEKEQRELRGVKDEDKAMAIKLRYFIRVLGRTLTFAGVSQEYCSGLERYATALSEGMCFFGEAAERYRQARKAFDEAERVFSEIEQKAKELAPDHNRES